MQQPDSEILDKNHLTFYVTREGIMPFDLCPIDVYNNFAIIISIAKTTHEHIILTTCGSPMKK